MTDVMCPACDALLAAYQAPLGASAVPEATAAITAPVMFTEVPGSTAPAPPVPGPPAAAPTDPVPPEHRPRSMSPIGDALERTEAGDSTIGTSTDGVASDELASELAKMADNDSDLARAVDERLRGVKVRFDGATPTIETSAQPAQAAQEDLPAPLDAPSGGPATPPPAESARNAGDESPSTGRTGPVTIVVPSPAQRRPIATSGPGQASPVLASDAEMLAEDVGLERVYQAAQRHPGLLKRTLRFLPFVLIFLFLVLGFDRTVSIISGMVMLVLGAALVIGLLMATSRVGRKTTSMPRDDRFRNRR